MRWRLKLYGLGLCGLGVGLFLAGVPLPSSGVAPAEASGRPTCRVTWVVDGDTLHIDCGQGERRVRLMGYDTPEIYHPKCAAEKKAGGAETRMMKALVASGPVTGDRVVGIDRYGRDLAWVAIGGKDVTKTMLKTPWALPYSGHAHPDWCGIIAGEHLPDSAFRQATLNPGG